jgi:hypothetical protein
VEQVIVGSTCQSLRFSILPDLRRWARPLDLPWSTGRPRIAVLKLLRPSLRWCLGTLSTPQISLCRCPCTCQPLASFGKTGGASAMGGFLRHPTSQKPSRRVLGTGGAITAQTYASRPLCQSLSFLLGGLAASRSHRRCVGRSAPCGCLPIVRIADLQHRTSAIEAVTRVRC